jgi:hypothetical protein
MNERRNKGILDEAFITRSSGDNELIICVVVFFVEAFCYIISIYCVNSD